MSKKESKKITKKSYNFIIILVFSLMGLGLFLMILTEIIPENDSNKWIYPTLGWSFFGLIVISLVILFVNYKRLRIYELEKKAQKVQTSGYLTINNVSINTIKENLNKFKYFSSGYYHKRNFSFLKDYINYYIKFINSDDI